MITIVVSQMPTDWQNHGVHGFISGTITKKMRLAVDSTKNESGERKLSFLDGLETLQVD